MTNRTGSETRSPTPERRNRMSPASFDHLDVTLERWSERLNPVLVKEVRQVLKSRGFAAAFLVMLCVAWLASLALVAQAGNRLEFGEFGRVFFGAYLTILMLALCFVVPMIVMRSVASEFEHRTFESLAITTLSAQRVVWGKLQGALVQMAAYYSAVTPFLCFTYLLGGISLPAICISLTVTAIASLAVCLAALMLGSLARGGAGQVIATLVLLAAALFAYSLGTPVSIRAASAALGWTELGRLVAGFACFCYAGLFYGMLTLGIAFNQFTPTIQDRTAPYAVEYSQEQRQRRTERMIEASTTADHGTPTRNRAETTA